VSGQFVWTGEEVVKFFLATKWEEGWTRGSLGQCLFYLLRADPEHERKVEESIATLAGLDLDAAFAAMYLTLAGAREPRKTFDTFLRTTPRLGDHDLIGEVSRALDKCGWVAWEC
jgi:hypothetical protein